MSREAGVLDRAPGSHGGHLRQALQPDDHGTWVQQAADERYSVVHGCVQGEAVEGQGVLDERLRGLHIRDSAREVGSIPPGEGYRGLAEPGGTIRGCI